MKRFAISLARLLPAEAQKRGELVPKLIELGATVLLAFRFHCEHLLGGVLSKIIHVMLGQGLWKRGDLDLDKEFLKLLEALFGSKLEGGTTVPVEEQVRCTLSFVVKVFLPDF